MKKVFFFFICIILLLIPLLFWGRLYSVGGDDTRAYYLFPAEFLLNFTFKVTSDNTLGALTSYYPKSFWAPFFILILMLKQIPFLHVEFTLYGLNLLFGFLFFYLFLGLWTKQKNKQDILRISASLFYVFSSYLINTFYTNQILGIYLVSGMPMTLFFFLKYLQSKKYGFLIISVISFSILGSTFSSFPWSMAFLMASLPILIYWSIIYKKDFFLGGIIWGLLFLLLNMHWLAYHIYEFINAKVHVTSTSFSGYYSSTEFRHENEGLIKSAYSIFDPLSRIYAERKRIDSISLYSFVWLKIFYMFIIILAGVLSKKDIQGKNIYFLSLSCLLLSFFFFQPNFGQWSLDTFLFLNNNVPFFSIFRNMYDKFSYALAFYYAFAFFFSFSIVISWIKKQEAKLLLIFISFFITLVNTISFIFPVYNDDSFSIRVSGTFNKDFQALTADLKKINTGSRVLWLPMNYPSYLYIEDEYNKNHFYFGPSLLTVLINQQDYVGYLSFSNIYSPYLGDTVFKLLHNAEYKEVGELFQQLNVQYIIINHQKLSAEANSFLYSKNMLEVQNDAFKNAILGKKLKDFGKRYSLYEINNDFRNSKFYLESSFKTNNKTFLKYQKISDTDFIVDVAHLKQKEYLIFQDLYNPEWEIDIVGKKTQTLFSQYKSKPVNNYLANSWVLESTKIRKEYPGSFKENTDGSISMKLHISFFPALIVKIGYIITMVSVLVIIILFTLVLLAKKRLIKSKLIYEKFF